MRNLIFAVALSTMLLLLGALFAAAVVGKDAPDGSAQVQIAHLQTERVETLRQVVVFLENMNRNGFVDIERLFAARSDLLEARLELASTKAERLMLLQEHYDLAKSDEELARARFRSGSATQVDYLQAKARRLQREVAILRENGG